MEMVCSGKGEKHKSASVSKICTSSAPSLAVFGKGLLWKEKQNIGSGPDVSGPLWTFKT